jgi:hypothetical protein
VRERPDHAIHCAQICIADLAPGSDDARDAAHRAYRSGAYGTATVLEVLYTGTIDAVPPEGGATVTESVPAAGAVTVAVIDGVGLPVAESATGLPPLAEPFGPLGAALAPAVPAVPADRSLGCPEVATAGGAVGVGCAG